MSVIFLRARLSGSLPAQKPCHLLAGRLWCDAHGAGTQNISSHWAHPSWPCCAAKGGSTSHQDLMLGRLRGSDSVLMFPIQLRLPMISMSFATKGWAKSSFQCHCTPTVLTAKMVKKQECCHSQMIFNPTVTRNHWEGTEGTFPMGSKRKIMWIQHIHHLLLRAALMQKPWHPCDIP